MFSFSLYVTVKYNPEIFDSVIYVYLFCSVYLSTKSFL